MKIKNQDLHTNKNLVLTFVPSVLILFLLCYLFEPQFNTNDDVVMQMAAHGFGVFEKSSPNLIFSNILWGKLVQVIPTINGVLGYSLATISTLFFVTWALTYVLKELTQSWSLSILAIALIMARAVLFPQFTINAGLLTVTAVCALILHIRRGDNFSLCLACIFAFIGYLVRVHEFFLVLVVALPLFPFRKIWNAKKCRHAILFVSLLIAVSEVFNWASYQGQEWSQFKDNLISQQPYVNYGASEHLKKRLDITSKYGYSDNDLDLLSAWFYVDPQLANPKKLNAMTEALGPLGIQEGSIKKALQGLYTLTKKPTLPLFVAAILLFFLYPKLPLVIAFVLLFGATYYLGLIGRPSILRVYYPLISLLVLAPLIIPQQHKLRKYIAIAILSVACVWNFSYLYKEQIITKNKIRQVQSDIKKLPPGMLFIWGGSFPFESAYPVLTNNSVANKLKFYSLGWNTLAPYSVSTNEEKNGDGLIKKLLQSGGLLIFADSQYHGKLLATYCQEKFGGQFELTNYAKFESFTLLKVECHVESNRSTK